MITISKKPRTVVICGHEIKIKYRKKMNNLGEFYGDEKLILICNDDKWREHLLHEILHAVMFYSGQSEHLSASKEEAFVRALENGLKTLNFSF